MVPNAFGGKCRGFGMLALWSTYQLNHENTDTKMCSWVAAELHAAEQEH